MGVLVFVGFLAGCGFLVFLIFEAKHNKFRIKQVLFSCWLVIYIIGFFIANQAVGDACTHGNCIHGWYSKYNYIEKFIALLWVLSPGVLLLPSNDEEDTELSNEIE